MKIQKNNLQIVNTISISHIEIFYKSTRMEPTMFEIGSEFNFEFLPEYENLTDRFKKFDNKKLMRCGRDSIGFIADDILLELKKEDKEIKAENITAFLPALSCDSMYLPFKVRGMKVEFYAIDENLKVRLDNANLLDTLASNSETIKTTATKVETLGTAESKGETLYNKASNSKTIDNHADNTQIAGNQADKNVSTTCNVALIERLKSASHPVILTMNYYGAADQRAANAEIKKACPKAKLIEDVTHLIFNDEKWDTTNADYILGSIRKWLGVADGAVVIKTKKKLVAKSCKGVTDFVIFREKALKMKTEYLAHGGDELKAEFRGLLSQAEDSMDNGLSPYEISTRSRDYLRAIDVTGLCAKRKNNYEHLYSLLKALPECGEKFELLPKTADDNVPFMLPIVMHMATINNGKLSRDEFETLLARRGVYAPVLWPIAKEAEEICQVSKNIADNMLTFWIDQRYDRFHMEHVAQTFAELLRELN